MAQISYANGSTSLGNLTYTYDADGRRISMGGSLARMNLPAAMTGASFNAANELLSWNGATLTYDANGNLTGDGARTYNWDARNRLASVGSSLFAYDASGHRTSRTIGGTTTSFLYDGDTAVQEQVSGTPSANLLTGLGTDQVFARTDASGTVNLLTDGMNSTLALLNAAGVSTTQYSYDPFGGTTASGAASANATQFTGRENDGTGLMYYRARYYHPGMQRFISQDPRGFAGGDTNLYAYAGNSPANLGDPSGETAAALPIAVFCPECLPVLVAGTVAFLLYFYLLHHPIAIPTFKMSLPPWSPGGPNRPSPGRPSSRDLFNQLKAQIRGLKDLDREDRITKIAELLDGLREHGWTFTQDAAADGEWFTGAKGEALFVDENGAVWSGERGQGLSFDGSPTLLLK